MTVRLLKIEDRNPNLKRYSDLKKENESLKREVETLKKKIATCELFLKDFSIPYQRYIGFKKGFLNKDDYKY